MGSLLENKEQRGCLGKIGGPIDTDWPQKKKNRVFFFSSRNLSLGWYAVTQPEMAVLEETTHSNGVAVVKSVESITTGKQRALVLVSSRDLSRMWYGSCRSTTTRKCCVQ